MCCQAHTFGAFLFCCFFTLYFCATIYLANAYRFLCMHVIMQCVGMNLLKLRSKSLEERGREAQRERAGVYETTIISFDNLILLHIMMSIP